jgi:hypothetical protein
VKFDLFVGIVNKMVIYFISIIGVFPNSAEVKAEERALRYVMIL